MKKNSTLFIEIGKTIINCLILPMYFIKMFHDVAHFDASGGDGSVQVDYFYSIYDIILREGLAALLWISIVIIIFSTALSVFNIIIKDKKTVRIFSHIMFGISIVLFFVLLFLAATVQYNY